MSEVVKSSVAATVKRRPENKVAEKNRTMQGMTHSILVSMMLMVLEGGSGLPFELK